MTPMNQRAMALVEIIVSMLVLAVVALGVASTISLVNSGQVRSAGGGSLDLQALGYARETLEQLRNNVSTNEAAAGAGAPLLAAGSPYNANVGLPASFTSAPVNGTRTYTVTDVDFDTDGVTDYKRVTVVVNWADQLT